MEIRPKKRFGQNYLHDKNIVRKICTSFYVNADDTVLEIGPGRGALTELILPVVSDYLGIEIDRDNFAYLSEKFGESHFRNEDILKFEMQSFCRSNKSIRVIGNIPYNLTSPIIFKLIRDRNFVTEAQLLIQLEVARRITAKPRTKEYGILSVLLQSLSDVELLFKVPPTVFYPRPKVSSAVISIKFWEPEKIIFDVELFIKVIKAAFGNRRKTLKNSFGNTIFQHCNFSDCPIDLSKRAEELSVGNFKLLTKFLETSYGR